MGKSGGSPTFMPLALLMVEKLFLPGFLTLKLMMTSFGFSLVIST
jgi:hypothetical protein